MIEFKDDDSFLFSCDGSVDGCVLCAAIAVEQNEQKCCRMADYDLFLYYGAVNGTT